jgi:hypothetical protein
MFVSLWVASVPGMRARVLPVVHLAVDLPAADLPGRPVAHPEQADAQAGAKDTQEHARKARNEVSWRQSE